MTNEAVMQEDMDDVFLTDEAMRKRKRMFVLLGGAILAISLGCGTWWELIGSRWVSTDNAYVSAELAEITPSIDGTVKDIKIIDTQRVKAGDVLVVIDDIDAKLDLARARGNFDKATADVEKAKIDLRRRNALISSGSISGDELTSSENSYQAAKAAYDTAKAAMMQTQVNLDRTIIKAPIDGVVAKRAVKLGQKVRAGTPLMSIVPVDESYVNANFKEGQLAKVSAGQNVELTSDLYGSAAVFHGKVLGFSGGTGSVFAAIPAQNATGNWIKVVQRLPIRISLDPKELQSHPLQVGLSMTASVDLKTEN